MACSRLCHINSRYVGIMSSLGLIPRLSKDFEKCETCSQAKITKRSHKSVVRNIELLELIHSDLCEFEGILTRGGNRCIGPRVFKTFSLILWGVFGLKKTNDLSVLIFCPEAASYLLFIWHERAC